jgi:hypothetical protein
MDKVIIACLGVVLFTILIYVVTGYRIYHFK